MVRVILETQNLRFPYESKWTKEETEYLESGLQIEMEFRPNVGDDIDSLYEFLPNNLIYYLRDKLGGLHDSILDYEEFCYIEMINIKSDEDGFYLLATLEEH
jgi:hypothetical protein